MFAKSRSSGSAPSVLLPGPLENLYEIDKQSATAGPENAWRIYDAYAKLDRKEVSIFFFDKRSVEKLHKPKRKEIVTEILRRGARQLERFSHPKILQAYKVEECADSLAFTSEPVLASLANILAYQEQQSANLTGQSSSTATKPSSSTSSHRTYAKEYELLDIEIKYGILQITEALLFLHGTCKVLHRNVCPASIVITKRGTWKLAGLEFIEKVNEIPIITLPPWSNRMSKMTQPNLDYIAPEVQRNKEGGYCSDMYSFGMTICAIFNQGRPLIQANHNCSEYQKQLDTLKNQVKETLPLIPLPLREAVSLMLHVDPEKRPTIQVLSMIKYFQDPPVHALQFLDVSKMKDVHQKEHFYTSTLKGVLPYIPKKLWYQHIWTYLQTEMESKDVQSAVLQPVLYIVQNSTQEEYDQVVFPSLRSLFSKPKSIQGTVTLLENLHLILRKTSREYVDGMVLPMLYTSFDNSTTQVQTAAFVAVANVTEYIDDEAVRNIVLPKLLQAFDKNLVDARILMNVIPCLLHRLEKQKIIDCILPLLFNVKLQEPEMVVRVVRGENVTRLACSDLQVNVDRQKVRSLGELDGHAGDALSAASDDKPGAEFGRVRASPESVAGHAERYRKEPEEPADPGQPVAGKPRSIPESAASAQHRQHVRSAVQHTESANRAAEDFLGRGHGQEEQHKFHIGSRVGREHGEEMLDDGHVPMVLVLQHRQQQLPESGERVHQSTAVGQHRDDAKDTGSRVVRELSRRNTWRQHTDSTTFQHRFAGAPRVQHQSVSSTERRHADHQQQRATLDLFEHEQHNTRTQATLRLLHVLATGYGFAAAGWHQHGKTTTPHLSEPQRATAITTTTTTTITTTTTTTTSTTTTTTTTTNSFSITPATGTAFPLTLRYNYQFFNKQFDD